MLERLALLGDQPAECLAHLLAENGLVRKADLGQDLLVIVDQRFTHEGWCYAPKAGNVAVWMHGHPENYGREVLRIVMILTHRVAGTVEQKAGAALFWDGPGFNCRQKRLTQPMVICLGVGFTSVFLGMLTISTPLRCSALICSVSTSSGRRKLRLKEWRVNSQRV